MSVSIAKTPPLFILPPGETALIKTKIREIFVHKIKYQYNGIIVSDSGIFVNDIKGNCLPKINDIKTKSKDENLYLIVKESVDLNKEVFHSNEFDIFRKSYKFDFHKWAIVLVYIKKGYKFINLGEEKKINIVRNFDLKFGPSILIFFFGNFILFVFLYVRNKL